MLKIIRRVVRSFCDRGCLNWLSDSIYLFIVYWAYTGRKLNLKNPKTYNEKLQWLKLYDRRPEYSIYVDKYAVRSYVADKVGEKYLIPIYGVYNGIDEINWDSLPDQFVLKCTHGSGSNIICSDKSKLDIDSVKKQLRKWMKKNWYWFGREWPYKNVKPRIICEKYLQDNITDYKFMCFSGKPLLVQIHCDRYENHTLDFYNCNWEKTEIRRNTPTASNPIPKPKCFEEMLWIAEKLSEDEIHVRIDLYEVNGRVYFSEKTLYSASGFTSFAKQEYDEYLGKLIKLPID